MAALVLATMYRKLYPRYQRHKPERCTHGFSADSPPSHRHTCHTRVHGCHPRTILDVQVGLIIECLRSVGVGTMHDSVPSLYKLGQMRCDVQISREPSAKRCPNQRIPKGAGRRLCQDTAGCGYDAFDAAIPHVDVVPKRTKKIWYGSHALLSILACYGGVNKPALDVDQSCPWQAGVQIVVVGCSYIACELLSLEKHAVRCALTRRRALDERLGSFSKTITPLHNIGRNGSISHAQGAVALKVPQGHYCFSSRGGRL